MAGNKRRVALKKKGPPGFSTEGLLLVGLYSKHTTDPML
jgi:hypothetical protein